MSAATRRRAGLGEAGITVLVGLFLTLQPVSTDLYLASLPGLAARFDASAATVQLTLSLFMGGFGAMQLVAGPMTDRYGRRPLLIGALSLFVAASLACAASPDMTVLVAARFAQAVGCCTVVVVGRAIVRDAFAPADGARVLAHASSILGVFAMAGPIVGSLLEVAFGFRGAFVFIAALGAALLAISARMLPETLARPDVHALVPRQVIAGYAAISRSPVFLSYTAAGAASYGGLFAFISGSSFVMIGALGVPAGWFGACFAVAVAGYLGGTIVCRRLLPRLGPPRTIVAGASIAAATATTGAILAHAGVHHVAAVLVPSIGYFFGHGIVFPCAQSGATASFAERAGAAAGLFGALVMGVAVAIGTWIGASYDGTTVPLMTTLACAGFVALASARFGVLRHPGET